MMKFTIIHAGIPLVCLLLFISQSCIQGTAETEAPQKIENALKSVSLFYDSTSIDPAELKASLDRVNVAIDSIGYPDAGYQLWTVQSNDSLGFRLMVEGYWPDQETYNVIHDHELYKAALEAEDPLWQGLKNTWYYRFTKVR